jgi:hypothetical protein
MYQLEFDLVLVTGVLLVKCFIKDVERKEISPDLLARLFGRSTVIESEINWWQKPRLLLC